MTYEQRVERLRAVVRELESTELTLERALEIYEEGVRLCRSLNEDLTEAERRMSVMVAQDAGRDVPPTELPLGEFVRGKRP